MSTPAPRTALASEERLAGRVRAPFEIAQPEVLRGPAKKPRLAGERANAHGANLHVDGDGVGTSTGVPLVVRWSAPTAADAANVRLAVTSFVDARVRTPSEAARSATERGEPSVGAVPLYRAYLRSPFAGGEVRSYAPTATSVRARPQHFYFYAPDAQLYFYVIDEGAYAAELSWVLANGARKPQLIARRSTWEEGEVVNLPTFMVRHAQARPNRANIMPRRGEVKGIFFASPNVGGIPATLRIRWEDTRSDKSRVGLAVVNVTDAIAPLVRSRAFAKALVDTAEHFARDVERGRASTIERHLRTLLLSTEQRDDEFM